MQAILITSHLPPTFYSPADQMDIPKPLDWSKGIETNSTMGGFFSESDIPTAFFRLHFRPVPPLQRLALSALPSGLMIFPDGGLRLAPHVGYLEGLDRLLAMTGDVARAFLLEPSRGRCRVPASRAGAAWRKRKGVEDL